MPRARHAANFAIAFARPAGVVAPVFVLAATAGFLAPAALAQSPSFTLMGWPSDGGPNGSSRVNALSADGRSATGSTFSAAVVGAPGYLWTADGGRNDFGRAAELPRVTVGHGISGDGLTVVGAAGPDGATPTHAFTWSPASGYRDLGLLPGYVQSSARDASDDGSVVVGWLDNGNGSIPQAFRWTQGGGMQGLGVGTRATAISGDGNVIVGGTGPSGNRPFTWTSSNGLQFLPTLDGSSSGNTNGVNHNGSMVIGESGVQFRGTLWMNGVPLDLTNGSTTANLSPNGLSDDGSVVVGTLNLGQGGMTAGIWTQATGMIRLSDYLTANGVSIPAGFSLFTCSAVSADGRTFSGFGNFTGLGNNGFVATIPPPCPADLDNDGLLTNGGTRDRAVTIDDLLYFLTAFESGNLAADLDNGSGTGTRDNAVTIDDLLYFLTHFESGC